MKISTSKIKDGIALSHWCNRCRQTFHSYYKLPTSCGKCKSKVWNKERAYGENATRSRSKPKITVEFFTDFQDIFGVQISEDFGKKGILAGALRCDFCQVKNLMHRESFFRSDANSSNSKMKTVI